MQQPPLVPWPPTILHGGRQEGPARPWVPPCTQHQNLSLSCSEHLLVHSHPIASPQTPHPLGLQGGLRAAWLSKQADSTSLLPPASQSPGKGEKKHKALWGWGTAGAMRPSTPRPPPRIGTERWCQFWESPSASHWICSSKEKSARINEFQKCCPRLMKPYGLAANDIKSRLSPDAGPGDARMGNGCSWPRASQGVCPLLARPPCPGEAPRQHHPTPANIWDRQVCAKLPGWAGRGWGPQGWRGRHRLRPHCTDGEPGGPRLGTLALGLSQQRLLGEERMLGDSFSDQK